MRFAVCLVVLLAGCAAVEQSGMACRMVDSQYGELRGSINWGHPVSVVVTADTGAGWGIDLGGVAMAADGKRGLALDAGFRSVGTTDRYTSARCSLGFVAVPVEARYVALGAGYEAADVGGEVRGYLEVGWRF